MRHLLKIVAVNVLIFIGLLFSLEAAFQLIAVIYPSYDVLFLQPDRVVGWKQVPNLHWTWAGHHWYASDFSVSVQTNPLGFRDVVRTASKPQGVKRLALLGDSFIEAVQVPLEKTAGQLLERALNDRNGQNIEQKPQWQVLNFGISNYGVGQYLLTWRQYARQYEPEYVAIFVARFHMQRTVEKYEQGAFAKAKTLWVRPTFRFENDQIILEPAKDFDEFIQVQNLLIANEFHGLRSRRKRQWILPYYAGQLWQHVPGWIKRRFDQGSNQVVIPKGDADLLALNLKLIQELGREVASSGGKLIVLDVSRYFDDSETVSSGLKDLCTKNGFGYIPAYENLLNANAHGISTRWKNDGHFNEAGNDILAKAIFEWMAKQRTDAVAP